MTREETERLFAVCDVNGKAIVALACYGGQMPREILTLYWEDVNWATSRIAVRSPKMEHHPGKAYRDIPMFPKLRPILAEAVHAAPDGAIYVVGGNHRDAADVPAGWGNYNLRTQLDRRLKRASLKHRPQQFHATQSSFETELSKQFDV